MKNNKGFSLVELIIVIGMLAILSAALVPQVMKYVAKARVTHDNMTCDTLKKTAYTLLMDDERHDNAAVNAHIPGGFLSLVYMPEKKAVGVYSTSNATYGAYFGNILANELEMPPVPKVPGKHAYIIDIEVLAHYTLNADGSYNTTFSIGDIIVFTHSINSSQEFKDYYIGRGANGGYTGPEF